MVEKGSSSLLKRWHFSASLSVSIQFENLREGFLLAGLDHAPTTVREREDLGLIQPGFVCDWSVGLSPQEVRGVMQGNHRQGQPNMCTRHCCTVELPEYHITIARCRRGK